MASSSIDKLIVLPTVDNLRNFFLTPRQKCSVSCKKCGKRPKSATHSKSRAFARMHIGVWRVTLKAHNGQSSQLLSESQKGNDCFFQQSPGILLGRDQDFRRTSPAVHPTTPKFYIIVTRVTVDFLSWREYVLPGFGTALEPTEP